MVLWEPAAARIASEGVQFLSRLGLEDVDAHGSSFLQEIPVNRRWSFRTWAIIPWCNDAPRDES